MSGPNTNDDPGQHIAAQAGAEPATTVSQISALDPEQVQARVDEALAAIAAASTTAELKSVRITHTGDHSALALANRQIGSIPAAQRKAAGKLVGAARGRVRQALQERIGEVAAAELEATLVAETVDVTLPVADHPQGAMHPLTALIDMVSDVFTAMGWEIAEGPECESEWFNFDALNLGTDHPARALQDTLWVDPVSDGKCLRTATSPVQIHTLLAHGAPVRIISPGKVFRADEYDATHLPVFHQVEGLCVDKGISMAHLKGTLDHFAQSIFGDVTTRFRPHYFPFTEPSAEVDVECFVCHGASVGDPAHPCRTCRSEGWIEWGGCGIVNPRVLAACGVDTEVYSGFAFGMGLERTVMVRNNASDLREFVEGDIRFSRSLLGEAR